MQQTTDVAQSGRTPGSITSKLKRLWPLAVALCISAAVLYLTNQYRHELLAFGAAGVFGLFVISILGNATLLVPAPVFIFACAAGSIYGPLLSGVVAGFGSAIGEMTGWLAGSAGNAVLPKNLAIRYLQEFIRRYGMATVFVLAALPNPLFDAGGILAGMIGMKWYKFLIAASLGKMVRLAFVGWACTSGVPALEQFFHPKP